MQTTTSRNQRSRLFIADAVARYGSLLRDRPPRLLILSQFFSSVGDWLNLVAIIIIASQLGVGELAVGGALAIRFIPRLVFQGPAGAIADRFYGVGLLFTSQVLMGIIASAFLLLRWYPELWLLYTLLFLLETAYTISRPAFMVLVLRVVPAEKRGAANGMLGTGRTAAQFVGGWLGAVLLTLTGESALFIINGLTFFTLAAVIWSLRPDLAAAGMVDEEDEPAAQAAAGDVPAGYRDLLRQKKILAFLAQQCSMVVLIQAAVALFVVKGMELHRGEEASGTFIAMVGLGLVTGSLAAGFGRYLSQRALLIVALAEVISAVFLLIFGFSSMWWIALVALALTGIASQISEIAGSTFFQNRLPEAIYGRFFSLYLVAVSLGGLAGSFLGPLLRLNLSVGVTLAIVAIPPVFTSALLIAAGNARDSLRVQSTDQSAAPARAAHTPDPSPCAGEGRRSANMLATMQKPPSPTRWPMRVGG